MAPSIPAARSSMCSRQSQVRCEYLNIRAGVPALLQCGTTEVLQFIFVAPARIHCGGCECPRGVFPFSPAAIDRRSRQTLASPGGFLDNMGSPCGLDPVIERFDFSDLRELFAKANEEKSGDQLAGIAATIGTGASRGEAQARRFDARRNCPTAADRSRRR